MEKILLVQAVFLAAIIGFKIYLKTPSGKKWMNGE